MSSIQIRRHRHQRVWRNDQDATYTKTVGAAAYLAEERSLKVLSEAVQGCRAAVVKFIVRHPGRVWEMNVQAQRVGLGRPK